VDAREAIDAFHDLGARYLIPTQWGTFPPGNEPVGCPALELKRAIKERGLDPSKFLIMDIGQIMPIAGR
jgi:N-acyl-phosphatidylethanolamine-hydrolysing phospholipase D